MLAVDAGGGCLDIFTFVYPFSPLSPSLWETARYRLKYCLKGPLNPKQSTNQKIYPITLQGRWGTTDDVTTTPFQFVQSMVALVELAKSIPVHSLILSSHLFFCLPLLRCSFTVRCRIVFAKPEDFETCPNHLSFRFLTIILVFFKAGLDLSANLLVGNMVLLYEMFNNLWLHLISKACILFSSSAVKVHVPQVYRNMEITRKRISFTLIQEICCYLSKLDSVL